MGKQLLRLQAVRAHEGRGEDYNLKIELYSRRRPLSGGALQRSSVGARFRRIIQRVVLAQQFGYSRIMLLNYRQQFSRIEASPFLLYTQYDTPMR